MLKYVYPFALGVLLGVGLLGPNPLLAQELKPIQPFSLPDYGERVVHLQDYAQAQAVVLIFTSANCPWVQSYEARIQALHTTYAPQGVAFIAINSNDAKRSHRDQPHLLRVQVDFPYLRDAEQRIAQQLGASKNPEAFLLVPPAEGAGSAFKMAYRGSIDDHPLDASAVHDAYLQQAIEAVLRGEQPDPQITEPQGCNIRRSRDNPDR